MLFVYIFLASEAKSFFRAIITLISSTLVFIINLFACYSIIVKVEETVTN
jgi:hypothetical protein